MNQILTDEDLWKNNEIMSVNADAALSFDLLAKLARAIEQAILSKLNSAEPVGEVLWFDPSLQESPEKAGLIVDGYMSFMDKAKIGDRLYLHPPAPRAVEGWTAIHLKTGNEYQVIGEAIDATNTHCNQLMVIYQRDGKTFVREAEEFQEKFKASVSARSE